MLNTLLEHHSVQHVMCTILHNLLPPEFLSIFTHFYNDSGKDNIRQNEQMKSSHYIYSSFEFSWCPTFPFCVVCGGNDNAQRMTMKKKSLH